MLEGLRYQPGNWDSWYVRYHYDSDGRLRMVESSVDSVYWERDALYSYYPDGLLLREELGERRVQGLDYGYTLQGWQKFMNGDSLLDLGRDGDSKSKHWDVGLDVLRYGLNYFAGDYNALGLGLRQECLILFRCTMAT